MFRMINLHRETDPFTLKEVDMQGTVLAPVKCSIQTDTVARYCYRNDKYAVYVYKDSVHIPPLWMIDDCITFARCGYDSIKLNAIINSHMAMKKLQLRINSKSLRNEKETKYLGHWITSSLSNDVNIERRCNKAIGNTSQLLSILRQVSLGYFHFEIALLFRDSILISQLLFGSEIWIYGTKNN